ncbi:unnamed protein product [Prorocentrum cordatum]|uniref:Phospholipid scramblase n=1 Tax=Prorocentrum cordatum TaxID=2364126 RepID=A0ABN9SD53_9DINO|nr:unnamed protein product [Polarella glacialis]
MSAPAPSAPPLDCGGQLCSNGCGRPPFGHFATCCTHCGGPGGPHAHDCLEKGAAAAAPAPAPAAARGGARDTWARVRGGSGPGRARACGGGRSRGDPGPGRACASGAGVRGDPNRARACGGGCSLRPAPRLPAGRRHGGGAGGGLLRARARGVWQGLPNLLLRRLRRRRPRAGRLPLQRAARGARAGVPLRRAVPLAARVLGHGEGGERPGTLGGAPAVPADPALAEVLQAVGRARREDHQRRLQEQAAQLAAIRQQQLTDRDFAQRVNHQGTALTMFYPRRLSFELRAKMFSWRDQVNITGPGGFDWFCMLRASSLFSLRDTEVIANLSGEPLLALHRQFSWMHYRYRLERVGLAGLRMPLCSITRHNNLFSAVQYDIQMEAMTFGGMIHCQGQWFEDFVLYQGGGPACRIKKRPWTFPEVYDVTIEQGYDVLLLLGIACAIDHIHHEVEESRRR